MFASVLEESARVYFTTIFRSTWSLFSVCSSIFFSTSTASCATSFVVSFSEDSSEVVSASVVSSVLSLSLLFLEDVSLTITSLPSSPTTFTGSFASSDFSVLSVLSETSEAFSSDSVAVVVSAAFSVASCSLPASASVFDSSAFASVAVEASVAASVFSLLLAGSVVPSVEIPVSVVSLLAKVLAASLLSSVSFLFAPTREAIVCPFSIVPSS